jgi:hypothetical protein
MGLVLICFRFSISSDGENIGLCDHGHLLGLKQKNPTISDRALDTMGCWRYPYLGSPSLSPRGEGVDPGTAIQLYVLYTPHVHFSTSRLPNIGLSKLGRTNLG